MNITYELSKKVSGEEINQLRMLCGYKDEGLKMWDEAVRLALCVAVARDEAANSRLVGVGFVVGNNRHAQTVDLAVEPEYRKQGIASELINMRINFCREKGILYVGNTFNKHEPWLKDLYEKHGYRQIDFAMWLKDSIDRIG